MHKFLGGCYFRFVSIFVLICLLITGCTNSKKYSDPHFIQYNSYFSAELGSTYTLDLAYFLEKGTRDYIDPKEVQDITFKNSKTLKVDKFRFVDSKPSKSYEIKNISLDVSFIGIGNEQINSIEIHFRDNSVKTFPFGTWNFSVEPKDTQTEKFIEMGSKYPIVGSNFNGYVLSLKNNTDSDIIIKNIGIDLDKISLQAEPITIKAREEIYTTIPPREISSSYKFFIVRPRITYEFNNVEYKYYPYAQLSGFINMTDEDINKEAAKSM